MRPKTITSSEEPLHICSGFMSQNGTHIREPFPSQGVYTKVLKPTCVFPIIGPTFLSFFFLCQKHSVLEDSRLTLF